MTVAAVILAASPESALADADGVARVRRIVDAAWSGGALPVVVVCSDPDGAVAAALAGAAVTLAEPVPLPAGVPIAQIRRGIEVAREIVSGIDGAFVWPARMGWVSPETITSMIEAHGMNPEAVLCPTFEGATGWPVLLPDQGVAALASVAPDRMPPDIVADVIASGVPSATLDLGDPGTTIDGATPSSELPPYIGPTEPVTQHRHEWGSEITDAADETPLEGPALAPYDQA